jgi:hypothetical protein
MLCAGFLRLRQLLPFNLLVRPIFKQLESKKSVAFDVKQTRILPNSVSADSTKFLGILSVDCIPNRRYFINATNWLFSKRNEYQTDSNQLWNTIIT